MSRTWGIALIGLGMGSTPHAKSLLDLSASGRVEVRAAYSPTERRRAAFAGRFPFPTTGDLDAVVADPAVEVVVLATPPDARAGIVERLAAAGKHVISEKPVERTTAGAEAIVQTCERAGVTLGVTFQHRFRPAAERLAALVRDGDLGGLATVTLTVPWWRPQAYYDEPGRGTLARDGGGVLISQAIHQLDLMLALAGPVAEVSALAATTRLHRMETEDFVSAGLRFANGAVGSVLATTAAYPGAGESLTLAGTRATATLTPGQLRFAALDGREWTEGEASGSGGGADPMAFPHDWHRALHEDVLDALDSGRPPRVTGRGALAVHRLIDALLASATNGRQLAVVGAAPS